MDKIEKEQLIIKLVHKELKNFLFKLNKEEDDNALRKYGTPPKRIIIKHHDNFSFDGMKTGKILSAWSMKGDTIESLDDLEYCPQYEPRSGMYHNEGIALFAISKDYTNVLLEIVVGPRYGRGYIYEFINFEYGGIKISKKRTIWVS